MLDDALEHGDAPLQRLIVLRALDPVEALLQEPEWNAAGLGHALAPLPL